MQSLFINRWIKFAQKQTHRCEHENYRMVAIVLINKKLISLGWNNAKTHPKMRALDEHKLVHAELMALAKVAKREDLAKAQLFIYGETKAGNIITSKPCPCCQQLIKEANIKEVIYYNGTHFESYDN